MRRARQLNQRLGGINGADQERRSNFRRERFGFARQRGVERADDDLLPAREMVGAQAVRGGARRALRFQLEIEAVTPAHEVDDFRQGRHALALAGVESLDFGQRQVADGAVTVGRVVHQGIVHDDQRAVAAEVQVEFAHIRAQFDGALEGQQRVLGRVRGGAAMGDVQVVALHPQLTAE